MLTVRSVVSPPDTSYVCAAAHSVSEVTFYVNPGLTAVLAKSHRALRTPIGGENGFARQLLV